MTRILLLSEQHMIYPSIFSNYYRLLSINVKIFARMGFFNKNIFRLCSYSKFYGNQDNRKIPSATSSQHYFLLFPILGYKRGEQNSPFSRQGNCLKFISGPPVLLQGCRSREGGGAWPPRFWQISWLYLNQGERVSTLLLPPNFQTFLRLCSVTHFECMVSPVNLLSIWQLQ